MARALKHIKAAAVVLGTRRFREQDRIALILVEDFGRLDAAAYGAAKPGSRFSGRLEPFTALRILAAGSDESDLWTLKEAELLEPVASITDRLGLLALQAAAELIVHAAPGQAMEREAWPLVLGFRQQVAAARDPFGPLAAFAVAWSQRAGFGRPPSSEAAVVRFVEVATTAAIEDWHRFRITPATRAALAVALRTHVERVTDRPWRGLRLVAEKALDSRRPNDIK